MSTKQERRSEAFVLTTAVMEGGTPILMNRAVQVLPALSFAGWSAGVAALVHIFLLLQKGVFKQKVSRQTWMYILGVALFISVLAIGCFIIGTQYTSGINTALLLQFEMLWSFFIFRFLFKHEYTRQQVTGAIIILVGTIIILYNGSFSLNKGDLIILLGTFFLPFGNQCAKKALEVVPPSYLLFVRNAVAFVVFMILSFFLEPPFIATTEKIFENFVYVLLFGAVILVISKTFWYTGLKGLPLPKAISLVLCYPAFSLVFAALLGEYPTVYQTIGFVLTLCGVYVLTRKTVVSPTEADIV